MKVLHLNTHLDLGGISSYLEILGKSLIKKGHRVSVLSGGGSKVLVFEANGIHCISLPFRTKSELHPRLWRALPAVERAVREGGFDVLHAHTRVTEVLAWAVSRRTGVPFVTTAHGFYKPRFGRKLFPCWGERVIAVSPLVAEELQKTHRVPADKIRVVNNALDLEDFEKKLRAHDPAELRTRYAIPEKAFVIGCISRLVRDKGQEYLVEAAGRLVRGGEDVFLVLVGDGRERPRLESLVGKLGLSGRVRMIPGVEDTTSVLRVMDTFVHPATYREGFGLAIAEALAAGKPVILTRIPALDTLFTDGADALLVPPKDAGAIAQAVLKLSRDPERARSLALRGREKVYALCRAERQADEVEKVYQEVVREHGQGKKS